MSDKRATQQPDRGLTKPAQAPGSPPEYIPEANISKRSSTYETSAREDPPVGRTTGKDE